MTNTSDSEIRRDDTRPLSPHLQIYRLLPNMVVSIMHRITGIAIYFGVALFVCWLFAIALYPDYFYQVNAFLSSFFGRVLLFLFTWSLINHLIGGIWYLIRDSGRCLEKFDRERLILIPAISSTALTIFIWIIA